MNGAIRIETASWRDAWPIQRITAPYHLSVTTNRELSDRADRAIAQLTSRLSACLDKERASAGSGRFW